MTRHGHTRGHKSSPTYVSWESMLTRCTNKNHARYSYYGGAGVRVCDRWRNSFAAFLEDMGERPSLKHSLDRFPDKNGNYEPGNCRWATKREQRLNQARIRSVTNSRGEIFPSIIEAAEAVGGNRRCIRDCCTGRQKTHLGLTWSFAP